MPSLAELARQHKSTSEAKTPFSLSLKSKKSTVSNGLSLKDLISSKKSQSTEKNPTAVLKNLLHVKKSIEVQNEKENFKTTEKITKKLKILQLTPTIKK